MSHVMGVGIFQIGLNRTDLGSWRLTLRNPDLVEPVNKKGRVIS